MTLRMKRLLDLAEFKSKLSGQELAQVLKMHKNSYSRMKSAKAPRYDLLVFLKKTFNISWEEIGEALEDDYSEYNPRKSNNPRPKPKTGGKLTK